MEQHHPTNPPTNQPLVCWLYGFLGLVEVLVVGVVLGEVADIMAGIAGGLLLPLALLLLVVVVVIVSCFGTPATATATVLAIVVVEEELAKCGPGSVLVAVLNGLWLMVITCFVVGVVVVVVKVVKPTVNESKYETCVNGQ